MQPSHRSLSPTPAVIDTPILQPSAKLPPHLCQTGKSTESMEHTFSTQTDEALCPQETPVERCCHLQSNAQAAGAEGCVRIIIDI